MWYKITNEGITQFHSWISIIIIFAIFAVLITIRFFVFKNKKKKW